MCVAGTDCYFQRVNPAFSRLLGFSEQELLSRPFTEMIHPQDLANTEMVVSRLSAGVRIVNFENRYFHKDGSERILQWTATPRDHLIYAVARDVTASRAAEEVARKRNLLLEGILEHISSYVVVHDASGQVIYLNPPFCRKFGWSAEELAQVNFLFPKDIEYHAREEVLNMLRTPVCESASTPCRTRAGELVETVWRQLQLGDGQILRLGVDMTDQIKSERRFEQLAGEVPVGVFESDIYGSCTYVNRRWQELAGLTLEQSLGQGWSAAIYPEDRASVFAEWKDAVQNSREFYLEYRFQNPQGKVTWVEGRSTIMHDKNGHSIGHLGTVVDISQRHQHQTELESALQNAQAATQAKSEFLATISHEIRTPMNGIIGMCEILHNSSLDSNQLDALTTISSSADSLLVMLNDVLDFSKIEAGKMEIESIPFDLHQTVCGVTQLFAARSQEKGLSLETQFSGSPGRWFIGDPHRLRQVLLNLVSNAIKFTVTGGVNVKVEVGACQQQQSLVKIAVSDTGIGISIEAQERLFTKFMQAESSTKRRFGGTGLGLAITRQLVEGMGGLVRFESIEGGGTTFTIEIPLPVTSENQDQTPELSRLKAENRLNAHILVVDDNPINRKVARCLLEELGCSVEEAVDGVEAVARARNEVFSLILMDCQMPEMDGFEATNRLRLSGLKTPIVAMTANALAGDRQLCLDAGMDDYLSKPVKAQALRDIISNYTKAAASVADGSTLPSKR